MAIDPQLFETWTRGWALTRGAAAPVKDGDAWRIEVGQPDHLRRFLYPCLSDEVGRRGLEATEPFVFLKVCADPGAVRSMLPRDWDAKRTGVLMTLDTAMPLPAEPDRDYAPEIWSEGPVRFIRFLDGSGEEAARGRAVRVDDRIIYDRIAVAPDHQRRGLGGRVMRTLQAGMGGWGQGVLVATDAGARLYTTLGWRAISPYTTAVRL